MDHSSFGTVDDAYAARLATTPPEDDGPIWMVNFMRYKERADYGVDGDRGLTGREADDRYAPTEVLADLGAEIAYFGDVIGSDDGPDPEWDRMAVVRYPTRRSFIEMQERDDFAEKAVHKEAGMAFTIIMCSLPAGPVAGAPDGSGIVRFIAHPEGSPPSGGRAEGASFEVEGTVIGDQRQWGSVAISWSDRDEALPEGTMMVRTVPVVDQVRPLVDATVRDGEGGRPACR